MERFIDVNFFQNKCSTVLTKHFYILYFLCGAICFENYVRFKFKCFLIGYLFVAYLCCVVPQLKVLVQETDLHYVYTALGYFIFNHIHIVVIFILYCKRQEFYELFDLIDANSNDPLPIVDLDREQGAIPEKNIMKIIFKAYIGQIAWYLLHYFMKLMSIFLFFDTHTKKIEYWEFFIPFFCDNCTTATSYLVAFNLSFVFDLSPAIFYCGVIVFFSILSMYLKNRAIVLHNDIRYHSNAAFEMLEKFDADEEQELKKKRPNTFRLRNIARQRDQYTREYMQKVRKWIIVHQSLVKCEKQYEKCSKNVMEVEMMTNFFFIVTSLYTLSSAIMDSEGVFLLRLYVLYSMFIFVSLLARCSLGNVFEDMSVIISNAVYSMPWFYLPVEDQKVILIFLSLSERTQKLRVFGTFSLTLELIPRIMNNVKDYVQIMRLLVMRNRI